MYSMVNAQKHLARILPQAIKQVDAFSSSASPTGATESNPKKEPDTNETQNNDNSKTNLKPKSVRYAEFEKKLRAKTPLGKLDELSTHPYQEKEPLKPWPNNTNPHTGEIGGPAGPEPTRYGDWERKGRVTDF